MRVWAPSLLLSILVGVVFWPVGGHPFILFDDPAYVVRNSNVLGGLGWEGVQWAFASTRLHNWHPLTWVSHMADVELFGVDAGKHHLVSLAIHMLNTVLLFLLARGLTGVRWASWVVAAVFGVHPLHVESVAWVAERKDVLSGLFFMLAVMSYTRFVQRRSGGRYLLVLLAFAFGLLAKPMLVTLPLVLLVLDWWPLGRYGRPGRGYDAQAIRAALEEKLPLLLLATYSSIVAWAAQREGGTRDLIETASAWLRAENAVRSAAIYVVRSLWPSSLSVYYPFPPIGWPSWHAGLAAGALIALSVTLVSLRRRCPYALAGWLWFLVMLVPVIGLVRIGGIAMADRYTYLPQVGLLIGAAWCARPAGRQLPRLHVPAILALAAIVASHAAAARLQVGRWASDKELFTHAAAVTADNWQAHFILGDLAIDEGRVAAAVAHYREAAQIHPGYGAIRSELGMALERAGLRTEALAQLAEAVRMAPESADAHNNLGAVLYSSGRVSEASAQFEMALRIDPTHAPAQRNLRLAARYRR